MRRMRAKANPDPLIEKHTRARDGKVFELQAFRSGGWMAYFDGKVVAQGGGELQGFAHHRYPSNRRQAEAMAAAKQHMDARAD